MANIINKHTLPAFKALLEAKQQALLATRQFIIKWKKDNASQLALGFSNAKELHKEKALLEADADLLQSEVSKLERQIVIAEQYA